MQDIAVLTGAQLIADELGLELEDIRIEQLRRARRILIDKDREKRKERLARLTGGIAVVRVGAPSESEMKSNIDALDDAISSTKAAVEEGVVPGGGLALPRCIEAVAAEETKYAVDGGVVVHLMLSTKGNVGFDAARSGRLDVVHAWVPPSMFATGVYGARLPCDVLVVKPRRFRGSVTRRFSPVQPCFPPP